MSDIVIVYSGGSGGFLLLHFLLLSGQYQCSFTHDKDLESQWHITNPSKWKSKEIWPDNFSTLSSPTTKSKIYFFCNPIQRQLEKFSGKKIIIYTSFVNQLSLASYKHAHWFFQKSEFTQNREIINLWRKYYNEIKDVSSPDCPSVKHFSRLPKNIQEKMLSDHYYPVMSIRNRLLFNNSAIVNNTEVYFEIAPFIKDADIAIKLEDFVNSSGSFLLEKLNLPKINRQQQELIDKWKKLHPDSLLEQLGILP